MSDEHIPMDAGTRGRVQRGEVVTRTEPVPGWPTPRLIVHAIIEEPPDKVWRVIDNSDNYVNTMPRVKSSAELSRDGDVVRTKLTVGMPFPIKDMTAVTRATHTVDPGVVYKREWTLLEGDYRRNEGSWTFVPFDGDQNRTLARYEIHVVPNSKIPKKIQSLVQERAMPKLIDCIRKASR